MFEDGLHTFQVQRSRKICMQSMKLVSDPFGVT